MFVIEEVAPGASDEELAAVRVGPRIGHRQYAGLLVLQRESLIDEGVSVDAHSSRSISLHVQIHLANTSWRSIESVLSQVQERFNKLGNAW